MAISRTAMLITRFKIKLNFVEMSDKEFLEHSNNTNSMESVKSTEEVTNADMFSLLKTYMNDKSPGTEKNLNDRAFDLDKKK